MADGPAATTCLLVVDDEPDIRQGIADTLRRRLQGVEVLEACDGREALRILREQAVDVVFTDVRMPDMDGLELLRRIHESDPDVAAIVCTAYPDVRIVQKALNQEHIQKFFIKPVDAMELASGVAEVLWRHRRDVAQTQIARTVRDLVGETGFASNDRGKL